MILPPPRFSHFPHTTLSRSPKGGASELDPGLASCDDHPASFPRPSAVLCLSLHFLCRCGGGGKASTEVSSRSKEHTSELQSRQYLVCRLLLEKKKISNGSSP